MIENALFNKNNAENAANAIKSGAADATALQREMYNLGIERTAPFRDLGIGAIPGLTAMNANPVTPFKFRDAGKFLSEYYNGPEYQALNTQAADQILRNRAMTGGFRSGGTQVDLAQIAPTLGIGALQRQNQQDLQEYSTNQAANSDQFNRLYGIANLGANVSTGNANAGQQFGSSAGQNALIAANARANKFGAYSDISNGLTEDALTLGGKFMGLF